MLTFAGELPMRGSKVLKKRGLPLLCFLVFGVVFVAAIGCGGPPQHPTWSNATGAEQLETLMWQAVRGQDWTSFERRLSPTFIGVTAEGQALDRAGWLEYWKKQQLRDFSQGEFSVLPEGPDMKVSSILHAAGAGKDGLRVISVWQETGMLADQKKAFKSRWVLIATTITPIQSK
jgi:hypothetical protein